jgi:hypothetical protein
MASVGSYQPPLGVDYVSVGGWRLTVDGSTESLFANLVNFCIILQTFPFAFHNRNSKFDQLIGHPEDPAPF